MAAANSWVDNGAAAGWRANAPQVAKLLASLALPSGLVGPLPGEAVTALLAPLQLLTTSDAGHTEGGLLREMGACAQPPICGPTGICIQSVIYDKSGEVSGYRAQAMIRTDTVTIAVLMAGGDAPSACEVSTWVSGVSWSSFGTLDMFPTYHVPAFPSP